MDLLDACKSDAASVAVCSMALHSQRHNGREVRRGADRLLYMLLEPASLVRINTGPSKRNIKTCERSFKERNLSHLVTAVLRALGVSGARLPLLCLQTGRSGLGCQLSCREEARPPSSAPFFLYSGEVTASSSFSQHEY